MSSKRYPEEFKIEAVKQVTEKGYSVAEVAARSVPSTHANAVAEVEKLKPRFVSLCEEKSGRKSIGMVRWDSNQYGDSKIEEWRIHSRDTVVSIQ